MGGEKRCGGGEDRTVTFLGRGLALRSPTRLTLLVCPLCSQRNGERTAELGTCVWCGYEPAERDEVPCETDRPKVDGYRGQVDREGPSQRALCSLVNK